MPPPTRLQQAQADEFDDNTQASPQALPEGDTSPINIPNPYTRIPDAIGDTVDSITNKVTENSSPLTKALVQGASKVAQFTFGGIDEIAKTGTNMILDRMNQRTQALAKQGIDTQYEISATDRTVMSFARNEALQVAYVQDKLKKPVKRSPDGTLIWYNDQTNRWSPIDSPKMTIGDVADMVGAAPQAIAAWGGFIAGETVAGPVGGAATGGGASAAAEALTYYIGQSLGVNDKLGLDDVVKHAAGTGAMDTMMNFLGLGVSKIYDFGRKLKYPVGLDLNKIKDAVDNVAASDEQLMDIIYASTGKRWLPLTGQLTNDEALLSYMRQLKDHATLSIGLSKRLNENDSIVEQFFKSMNTQDFKMVDPGYERDTYQTLDKATQVLKDEKGNILDTDFGANVTIPRQGMQATLDKTLGQAIPQSTAGGIARNIAGKEYDNLTSQIKQGYQKIDDTIGYDPISKKSEFEVPVDSNIITYWNSLEDKLQSALSTGRERQVNKLTSGKLGEILGAKDAESIPEDSRIDLHHLNDEIQFRRQQLRDMVGSAQKMDFNQSELQAHIDNLVAWRGRVLTNAGQEDLLGDIEHVEELRRQQSRDFDQTLVGNMFKVDPETKKYTITNKEAYGLLFSTADKDAVALEQFTNIVKKDPSAMEALKKGVYDMYNYEVIDKATGFPKPAAHENFVYNKYPNQLRALFSPEELENLQKFGGFEETLKDGFAKTKQFRKELNRSWVSKLTGKSEFFDDTNPANMIDKIMSTGDGTMNRVAVDDFMDVINKHGMGPDIQQATADWVGRKVYSPVNGFNRKALTDFLQFAKGDNQAKLEAIMGPKYLDNLNHLDRILDISSREARQGASAPVGGGPLWKLARSFVVGPISREGNILTKAWIYNRSKADEFLYKIVMDPDFLDTAIQLDRQGAKNARAIKKWSIMGGAGLIEYMYPNKTAIQTDENGNVAR